VNPFYRGSGFATAKSYGSYGSGSATMIFTPKMFSLEVFIKCEIITGSTLCWVGTSSPLTPSDIDWDLLYEEEEEESEVDMKSHGSVITHLLSQVPLSNILFEVNHHIKCDSRYSLVLRAWIRIRLDPHHFGRLYKSKKPDLHHIKDSDLDLQ
jgi:hypothetical protein